MKTVSQIINQIKEIDCINTNKQVAESLGMSGPSLSNYKYRGTIPFKYLHLFCEKRGISFEILVYEDEVKQNGDNPENDSTREVIELKAQVALLKEMLEEERNRSK